MPGQLPLHLRQHGIYDQPVGEDRLGVSAVEEVLTCAILDRLLRETVVLNLQDPSYQLQNLEELLKQAIWAYIACGAHGLCLFT